MESCFSHCIFVLFYNIDKTMEYLMKKLRPIETAPGLLK